MNSFIWKTPLGSLDNNYWFHWLTIPERKSLLYLRGLTASEQIWVGLKEETCTIEHSASKNAEVRRGYFNNSFSVKATANGGKAIFILSPNIFRGEINPSAVSFPERDFSKYLKERSLIDVNSPVVKAVAAEILTKLPPERKNNPYWRADAVFQWIKQNISFSVVPKEIIERVARTIRLLPDHLKNNPFVVLDNSFNSFNIERDKLRRVSSFISMSPSVTDPIEKAKQLMEAADSVWRFFQRFWLREGGCSASRTIRDKMAKCVGIANTFVALCRALEIPSKTMSGYTGPELFGILGGHHAWALVYFFPYGWVEIDPTISKKLDKFSYENYGYEFLEFEPKCEAILIPDKRPVPRQYIEECKELLIKKPSFADKLLKKSSNPALEILESD